MSRPTFSPAASSTTRTPAPAAGPTPAASQAQPAGRAIELGNATDLVRSQSYGGYLDGDSNPNFRHKP